MRSLQQDLQGLSGLTQSTFSHTHDHWTLTVHRPMGMAGKLPSYWRLTHRAGPKLELALKPQGTFISLLSHCCAGTARTRGPEACCELCGQVMTLPMSNCVGGSLSQDLVADLLCEDVGPLEAEVAASALLSLAEDLWLSLEEEYREQWRVEQRAVADAANSRH